MSSYSVRHSTWENGLNTGSKNVGLTNSKKGLSELHFLYNNVKYDCFIFPLVLFEIFKCFKFIILLIYIFLKLVFNKFECMFFILTRKT